MLMVRTEWRIQYENALVRHRVEVAGVRACSVTMVRTTWRGACALTFVFAVACVLLVSMPSFVAANQDTSDEDGQVTDFDLYLFQMVCVGRLQGMDSGATKHSATRSF